MSEAKDRLRRIAERPKRVLQDSDGHLYIDHTYGDVEWLIGRIRSMESVLREFREVIFIPDELHGIELDEATNPPLRRYRDLGRRMDAILDDA